MLIIRETKRLTAPMIKQEEASKYRCKECNKLFRAPEFVIKHVASKHGEVVQPKLDEVRHVPGAGVSVSRQISYFNTFVLDPQRLQPTQQVPAAVNDRLVLPTILPTGKGVPPNIMPNSNPAMANFNSMAFNPQAMQQTMMMMMQMQQVMAASGAFGSGTPAGGATGIAQPMGAGSGGMDAAGMGMAMPLPLPRAPGGEDPRARRGRVSYRDLDEVGAGVPEPSGGGDGGDAGGLPY